MIGAGIVAEMYAKAFERGVEDAAFAGVFDPDAARAEAFANRLGGRRYASREELLADPAVDAVLILSPNLAHFEDARASLAAGKHVLVEKPVAETADQLRKLEAASAAAGRVCMPAHNYIYMEPVIRMRRMVAGNRFGTLASIWILYNIFHSEAVARRYGGVLREVAVHHAYSLIFLAGRPVTRVGARHARPLRGDAGRGPGDARLPSAERRVRPSLGQLCGLRPHRRSLDRAVQDPRQQGRRELQLERRAGRGRRADPRGGSSTMSTASTPSSPISLRSSKAAASRCPHSPMRATRWPSSRRRNARSPTPAQPRLCATRTERKHRD